MARVFPRVLLVLAWRHPRMRLHPRGTHAACRGGHQDGAACGVSPWRLHTAAATAMLCVYTYDAFDAALREPSAANWVRAILALLPSTQYVMGALYATTDHVDSYVEPGDDAAPGCAHALDVASAASVALVSIGAVATSAATPWPGWRLFLPLMAMRTYGRLAMCANSLIVVHIFCQHAKVMRVYAQLLEGRDWTAHANQEHHISAIMRAMMRIREALDCATKLLGCIFSAATVVGGVATGLTLYMLEHHPMPADVYASVSAFVLLQGLYAYVIWQLARAKQAIADVVNSAKLADAFLTRKATQTLDGRIRETATTIDWFLLRQLLSEQWLSFVVLGMPLHSGTFVKQLFAAVASFVTLTHTRDIRSVW